MRQNPDRRSRRDKKRPVRVFPVVFLALWLSCCVALKPAFAENGFVGSWTLVKMGYAVGHRRVEYFDPPSDAKYRLIIQSVGDTKPAAYKGLEIVPYGCSAGQHPWNLVGDPFSSKGVVSRIRWLGDRIFQVDYRASLGHRAKVVGTVTYRLLTPQELLITDRYRRFRFNEKIRGDVPAGDFILERLMKR